MQANLALRLARQTAFRRSLHLRGLATSTTANAAHIAAESSSSSSVSASSRDASLIPLSNVEAQWATLSGEEKTAVHEQVEVLQKKDWKLLSLDEKKAAYYVAFGPHGPRAPVSKPGDSLKIFAYTMALVGAAGILSIALRQFGGPPPKTMTTEWQEAENARAREMNINPITGVSSPDYKGKGFVH
ncbi:hypothetical protein M378DRAFT_160040 [Amanita muscaria Koide BX008]|uniref:Cytochrome c oxidase subunit IV n=1 Tax=Amanita muscaria (strain Koide BX008) TaxID=946122 RepID=A0A0C2TJB7_AMAMK|nr:hypothetical protein M378DRAFT_160040 [Amanita muscaria Koide BX008]